MLCPTPRLAPSVPAPALNRDPGCLHPLPWPASACERECSESVGRLQRGAGGGERAAAMAAAAPRASARGHCAPLSTSTHLPPSLAPQAVAAPARGRHHLAPAPPSSPQPPPYSRATPTRLRIAASSHGGRRRRHRRRGRAAGGAGGPLQRPAPWAGCRLAPLAPTRPQSGPIARPSRSRRRRRRPLLLTAAAAPAPAQQEHHPEPITFPEAPAEEHEPSRLEQERAKHRARCAAGLSVLVAPLARRRCSQRRPPPTRSLAPATPTHLVPAAPRSLA